jgi:hypothetical protein
MIKIRAGLETMEKLKMAEELLKQSLVEYLKDPSSKSRLLRDLDVNSARNFQLEILDNKSKASGATNEREETVISKCLVSGATHSRDELSSTDRPRKLQKRDANETPYREDLLIPSWVTEGKKGLFGAWFSQRPPTLLQPTFTLCLIIPLCV